MAVDPFHERIWQQVPAGAEPAHYALRRRFLLDRAGAARDGVRRVRALDVGCGEGQFAAALARAGFAVVGIDVAEEPLRRARAAEPELELLLVDPREPWPFEDASFDVAWAGETIEHVLDTRAWLSELRRVLRPGATLLLSTPAHEPFTRLALGLSRRTFEAHFDPRSDHVRFYTRRALAELLEEFGFDEVHVHAAVGLPGARRVLLAAARRARLRDAGAVAVAALSGPRG